MALKRAKRKDFYKVRGVCLLVTACVVAIDWAVDAWSPVYPHHHLTCTYL